MKRGRPNSYTPERAAAICEGLASGKSLIAVCKGKGMPAPSTVFLWLTQFPQFSEMYARARESQADYYAAEITEIADTCRVGEKVKTLPDGKREVQTGDMVERSKLQVDARKWLMAKLAPKRYGDRLELAGDKDNPIASSLTIEFVRAPGAVDAAVRRQIEGTKEGTK